VSATAEGLHPTNDDAIRSVRDGVDRGVYSKRNWQRFPFLTGDVAVTGSQSAISPELSGSIFPCPAPFVLELARIDPTGLHRDPNEGED
jgi:hypothetical protein